jgi:hypothetical protein
MRGIENHRIALFFDPVQRTHVGHKIIVAKAHAPLSEDVIIAAKVF